MKNKTTPYSKGKRWGYAVASAELGTGKAGVHKVDKAMKTCSQNARTGTKKLNQNERNAYRGIADGMYDAIMQSEKASAPKQKKASSKNKTGSNKSKKAFNYNYSTKVKGSYTVDGRFEPD